MKPIIKTDTRILRPCEYKLLMQGSSKGKGRMGLDNKTNLNTLLFTGLRYREAERLKEHPEWVDDSFIHLPAVAQKKKKRRMKERFIKLTPRAKDTLEQFFEAKALPSSWGGWRENLVRWARAAGLDPEGLTCKTTRKTWESWLVVYYPKRVHEILATMGHIELTAIQHYHGLAFSEVDKLEMKEFVEGW